MLVGAIGVRWAFPILDPIVGIGITDRDPLHRQGCGDARSGRRLIEGIEPEILAQIEHAPMHVAGVKGVQRVRARWLGHKVHADVAIGIDPDSRCARPYHRGGASRGPSATTSVTWGK